MQNVCSMTIQTAKVIKSYTNTNIRLFHISLNLITINYISGFLFLINILINTTDFLTKWNLLN